MTGSGVRIPLAAPATKPRKYGKSRHSGDSPPCEFSAARTISRTPGTELRADGRAWALIRSDGRRRVGDQGERLGAGLTSSCATGIRGIATLRVPASDVTE